MKRFLLVLRKDLLLLIRSREVLVVLFALSILLAVVISAALGSAYLNPTIVQKITPALLWILFVFVATITVERSFDEEVLFAGSEGVLLSGIAPGVLYLSKVASLTLLSLIVFGVSSCVLVILLNSPYPERTVLLVGPACLVAVGYASLATLCGAMAAASRLRGAFLSLILIPLLFPFFFGAIELSTTAILEGRIDIASPWVPLLLGMNALYLGGGAVLYRFVLR